MASPEHGGLVLDTFFKVFEEEISETKGLKTRIFLQNNVSPNFFKPHPVSYSLRDKEEELN